VKRNLESRAVKEERKQGKSLRKNLLLMAVGKKPNSKGEGPHGEERDPKRKGYSS